MGERLLPRVLGFWDGLAIGVGLIIGVGIFKAAPAIAGSFTTAGPTLLVWLLGAALSLLGALTFAELAATKPHTGGMYVFLLEGYGRPLAFVFGWQNLLIGPAGVGALAAAFAEFFAEFFRLDWDRGAVAVVSLLSLTALAIASTRWAALVMRVFTLLKVSTLAALVVLGTALLAPTAAHFGNVFEFASAAPAETPFMAAFGLALFAVVWTFGGWEAVPLMAGEIREPQRQLPRVLIATIALVTAVYLAVNLVYINALGTAELGRTGNAAADVGTKMLGPAFGAAITFMILCSIFGAMNGSVLSKARITFALANSGLAFRFLGAKSGRFGTPYVALAWQGLAGSALVLLWPSFFDLLGYQVFAEASFFALAAGAIFVFRSRGDPTPFRVPGYPWTPLAFIAINVAMLANSLWHNPVEGSVILGILAAGFPAFWIWRPVRPASMERTPGPPQ